MWKLIKSKIHGKGIVASINIKKNTKIIEYIGEKITKKEGDKRSEKWLKKYSNKKNFGSVYVFELNTKYDIDGSPLYNKARYINHSCDLLLNPTMNHILHNHLIYDIYEYHLLLVYFAPILFLHLYH